MSIDVPRLAFGINDLGLTPRQKTALQTLKKNILDRATICYLIQTNEHGEYTLALDNLWYEATYHHEFYEGKTKILDAYYDKKTQQTIIQIFTTKQTNLFFNLNVDECIIESAAPLCIDGKFTINTSLIINAPSLCFLDDIFCNGKITFKVEQGLGILGNVETNYLDIHAAYLHQSGHILAQEMYDLSVQTFQQLNYTKTRAGSLRLLAEQCEITGNFQVEKNTFLAATTLIIGANEGSTQLELLGNHHLHCTHGLICGDSQFIFRGTSDELSNTIKSNFLCDQQFFIESTAEIEFQYAQIDFNWVKNEGKITIIESLFDSKNVVQQGSLICIDSDAMITDNFSQYSPANSSLLRSEFTCRYTTINDGKFYLDQSVWKGENAYLTAGIVQVANSQIELHTSLVSEPTNQFTVTNVNGYIQMATLYGRADFDRATLKANTLSIQQNKITIKNSTITTYERTDLSGDIEINFSNMTSQMIHLSGTLNTNELLVHANQLECVSQQATMHQFIGNSNHIVLEGDDKERSFVFSESQLAAKIFSVSKNVVMKESYITGYDYKDMAHDITGKLTLIKSRFITESQIHHLIKQKNLLLLEDSAIQAHIIYSEADIASKNSEITCERFLQRDAALNLKTSGLSAHQDFILSNTNATIQESQIFTNAILLKDTTEMRLSGKSLLFASQELITTADTLLSGEQTMIRSSQFIVFGRVELSSVLLSAQELFIYEEFSAQNKTNIQVDERILLAKTAKVQFLDSRIESKDFHSLGQMAISDSMLKTENQLGLWSTSKTIQTGTVAIQADNMVLRGELELESTEASNQKKTTGGLQLQIKNRLDILPGSKIIGKSDLAIDADYINQSGMIELTANIFARGRQFDNIGSTSADTIYLGFDDVVMNHGVFSSKSMTVHSNFMNILGQVYAQQSLACSGFMSINLGFIAANNYTNDSFLSLNTGLIAPNLSSDPKYIFSCSNLMSVAKTTALMWMPTHTMGIQLASMIPGLFGTAANLYNLSGRFSFESLNKMRRHEYMPLFCQVKNIFVFGQGFFNTSSSLVSELPTWGTSFGKFINQNNLWQEEWCSTWGSTDWKNLGIRGVGAFAGSYAENSLLHANLGGSFVANTSKSSLMHINTGTEQSFFSHNINTHHLYNSGSSSGREATFLASSIENKGNMRGEAQFVLRADKMHTTGRVYGKNANIDLDKLEQEGQLTVNQGHVKVDKFTDDTSASTELSDVMLEGKTFDQTGQAQLKNVYIKEEEYFHVGATAQSSTSNVMIETNEYVDGGHLNYQQGYTVKAKRVTFTKDSVAQGAKTAEDKLFVPKPESTDTPTSQPSEDKETAGPAEPEKDFKPQHVLTILTDKATLGGKMSGGDYTQIHGLVEITKDDGTQQMSACDELIVEDSANINLKYGSIAAKESLFQYGAEVSLDSFNLQLGKNVIQQGATLELKNTSYTGDVLESSGFTKFDHTNVNVNNTHLTQTAREILINSNMSSKYLLDESTMSYQGQSGVVTDNYHHTGYVQKMAPPESSTEKNLFYVQAKSATLDGAADLDNGYYDIEHLGDGAQFAAGRGKYSLYMTSDSLSYITQDSFFLSDAIARDCDLLIKASDITFSANYNNSKRDLTFISTAGDVRLTSNIQAKNFYANSAKDILMNHAIEALAAAGFEAEGGFYNYGGLLNGDVVSIKAAEIKNITQGSNAARGSKLAVGSSGMINARQNLFLEATKGNIENHGGILRGGDYAQLIASGNVLNLCNERVYQGAYDTQKDFNGALIAGGNGTQTEGIGLYIKAQGQVISDASDFISNGSNYIEGVKGVHFNARQHTYIAGEDRDSKWYGKNTHVVDTATNVRGSVVHSNNGRNIIQSGEGEVTSVATRFSSPGGTDIYAKGNVKLYSLVAQNHHYVFKSYLWGLTKEERDYVYQSSTPTLFADNGLTRIQSAEGNVDARGAYFIGAGDLSIKAKGRIQLGVDILNHEINEKTRSFDWSAPGKNAWGAYGKGGNAWDIMTAEDATLAKLNSFGQSNNSTEFFANAANLGIDLANTTNSVMRGLSEDSLINELMARYGLGGASGFSPAFTLALNESKTKTKFQTQGQGGIDRGGNVKLEAGEGIDLENGVRVHAGGNLEIDAPELIARAAALHTSVEQTKASQNVGLSLTGQIQSVGASYSKTKTTTTNYVNAELSADGNMALHCQDGAMRRVELDGANISAKTLDANIEQLIIRDKQDISSTATEAFSASSTGQFTVYKGKGYDKVTNNSSGIHVTDGINTGDHHVQVKETYMEGGRIVTEGENHFTTDKLVSVALTDQRHFEGVGISGNVNDFTRLVNGKPTNTAGEQTFATMTITDDELDYVALQRPVIYGAKGTDLDINELQGDIHTSSADGKEVLENDSLHAQLDVPITNKDFLDQSAQNIKNGREKLAELFHPEQEPVDFGRPEPLIPVKETSEEDGEIDASKRRKKKEPKEDEPKKKKPHLDPELSAQEMEQIVDAGLKHLKFESPEKQHQFEATLAKAQQEKSTTGKVSPKTENQLKHQVTEALIKTLKAGTEEVFGKLTEKLGPEYRKKIISLLSNSDAMSHIGVKSYMGTKGALFTFTFNLVLAVLDKDVKKGDELKHSAAETSVDISIGLVMKFAIGEAAGPIGWALVGLDIADSFYSQQQVDTLVGKGLDHVSEAITSFEQGHYWDAFIAGEKAALQIEGAAAMRAAHELANITKPLVERVESMFDGKKAPKVQPSKTGLFKPDERLLRELAKREREPVREQKSATLN